MHTPVWALNFDLLGRTGHEISTHPKLVPMYHDNRRAARLALWLSCFRFELHMIDLAAFSLPLLWPNRH
jgi:hypothetical protein